MLVVGVLLVLAVFASEVCFVLCAHVVMTGCVEDALSSGGQICQFVCGQKSVLMVESLWGVQKAVCASGVPFFCSAVEASCVRNCAPALLQFLCFFLL